MSSGVVPNEHCKPAFDRVRTGKIKFVTFKIDDNAEKTEVCVEGAKQADFKFEEFLKLLPETESRYAVLDWGVKTDDGREFSKLFFISWVPDNCKAKEKMLYASSKQSLRNALSGVHLDMQAADLDDLTEEIFTMRALGK